MTLIMIAKIVVFSICIIPLIDFIQRKPDISFWALLNLYFDPGGYVSAYLGGNVFNRFNISDIMIGLIVFSLFAIKPRFKSILSNNLFHKFCIVLCIYLIYYYIIYGWLVPSIHNNLNYSLFLVKTRQMIYGLIILFSVYFFAIRGLKYFYYTTLFFGVVSLSLYWISLLSGDNISFIVRMQRYAGSEMTRIGMAGYGLFYFLFPLSLIAYLVAHRQVVPIKYKRWLYFSGIFMVLTQYLTLSRRTMIAIPGAILAIILLVSYIYRSGKLKSMIKLIVPSIILLVILNNTLPEYINYIPEITEDAVLLATTGMDSRGEGNYRISGTGDLLDVKQYIKKHLLFGSGYSHVYYGKFAQITSTRGRQFAVMWDAANEVPVYYLLFGYGLIGTLLICLLYCVILKLFLKFIKIIKIKSLYNSMDPLVLLWSVFFLFSIMEKFTYNYYNLGYDFGQFGFPSFAILAGLGFALYEKAISFSRQDLYPEIKLSKL